METYCEPVETKNCSSQVRGCVQPSQPLLLWRSRPSRTSLPIFILMFVLTFLFFQSNLHAAKIGELTETSVFEQALRFLSLKDPAVRIAVLGSIFLGINCGLLGSFIVVRKLALVGDALSHAVLPGVALGFMWNMTKDPIAIFVGATIAGLIGVTAVNLIKDTTKIKEDSVLGMVLAGFYGVGIVLLTMIQNLPFGNKSGLDKFLFGQAAALSVSDIQLIGSITLLCLIIVYFFYKEFLVISFDFSFAQSTGIPAKAFHYLLMLLLTFSVVVALQAVGVVLVSALLITPAATAYLLTDRMHRMLFLAALFGMLSGLTGAFLSFLGNDLPTGPFMVVAASSLFIAAFLFGPRYGLIPKFLKRKNQSYQIEVENTLKAIYQVLEKNNFKEEGVLFDKLAEHRNESIVDTENQINKILKMGCATLNENENSDSNYFKQKLISLTPTGWTRACEIVRNHRLWELYLTNEAQYAADHVHEDAEIIEHVLGDDTVRKLEKMLNFPTRDPHGKLIPGLKYLEDNGTHNSKSAVTQI